jgi:hypothetical protein
MKAIDYIRKGWTQGASARDAAGNSVYYKSTEAVCWCLSGAIFAAYPDHVECANAFEKVTLEIQKTSPFGIPLSWNDAPRRTQAEVILLLEKVGI